MRPCFVIKLCILLLIFGLLILSGMFCAHYLDVPPTEPPLRKETSIHSPEFNHIADIEAGVGDKHESLSERITKEQKTPDTLFAICAPGYQVCQRECVDVRISNKHCGACNRLCPPGFGCIKGKCESQCCFDGLQCIRGAQLCNGACVSQISDKHCGRCGNACSKDRRCGYDKTVGEYRCVCKNENHKECLGQCTDTQRSSQHCGACQKACPPNTFCLSGKCVTSCPKSSPDICERVCVGLQSDMYNCGKCGVHCPEGGTCQEGKCSCPRGLTNCSARCVDLYQDRSNCGACGKTCLPGQLCTQKHCSSVCNAVCDSTCVNIGSDRSHCGDCKIKCPEGQYCEDGRCMCPKDYLECNGTCINPLDNHSHCGFCGQTCQPTQRCITGKCQ